MYDKRLNHDFNFMLMINRVTPQVRNGLDPCWLPGFEDLHYLFNTSNFLPQRGTYLGTDTSPHASPHPYRYRVISILEVDPLYLKTCEGDHEPAPSVRFSCLMVLIPFWDASPLEVLTPSSKLLLAWPTHKLFRCLVMVSQSPRTPWPFRLSLCFVVVSPPVWHPLALETQWI